MFKKKAAPVLLILAIFAGAFSPLFGINKALAVDLGWVFPKQDNTDGNGVYTMGDQYVKIGVDPNFTTTTTKAQFVTDIKLSNLGPWLANGIANYAQDTSNTGTNAQYFDSGDNFGDWDAILAHSTIENDTAKGAFIEIGQITQDNNIPDSLNGATTVGVNFTIKDPINPTLPTEYAQGTGSGGSIKKINIGYYIWRKSAPQTYFFGMTDFTLRIPVQGLTPGTLYYARIVMSEDWGTEYGQSKIIKFTTPTVDPTLVQNQDGGVFEASINGEAAAGQFADLLDCGVGPWTWGGCIVLWIYDTTYYASYLFLWLCGYIMDAFIGLSISSKVYVDSTFVVAGWSVVRDLANIFLIFILIYIAIGTILKMERVHANKMLPAVIIIGLLLNFSLFFSRVIIDLGNSLAHVFYSEIKISGSQDESILKDDNATSLSSSLAKGFELSNIFSGDAYNKMANGGEKPGAGTMFFVVILGIIVNFVAAWTFLKCGLFFLGRILGLWFSMIFAPIAFVSSIVKETSGVLKQMGWQQWIDNLIKLSLMAPLFLLFMYLVLLLLQSNFMDGFVNDKNSYDWIPFMTIIIMNFMLIIGLVNAAKGIAEDLSGSFGKQVAGVIGTALAVGVGATAIAGGAVVRNTLGRTMKNSTTGNTATQNYLNGKQQNWWAKSRGYIGSKIGMDKAEQAIGDRLNRNQKKVSDKQHAEHELDDYASNKFGFGSKIKFKDLGAPQQQEVRDTLNRDIISKAENKGKKYDQVGAAEQKNVDSFIATHGGDTEKAVHELGIMNAKEYHGAEHLEKDSKYKQGIGNQMMQGAKNSSWDPRNLEKSSFKLLAAAGMLMAASFKQMTGTHYGTSEKNFGKDLLSMLKSAGTGLQQTLNVKRDPGPGSHDAGHGKKDDHGGGHH